MNKREERISLLILFVFTVVLRLWLITQKNMWFDEVYSWQLTQGTLRDIVIGTAGDIHPPFYYFVLKFWEYCFGSSVYVLRSLSVILSASAVFFIYPISKRIMGVSESLVVVFLYSISPLNIYFAQEVRMASLNLFLNLGSVFFLMLLTEKLNDRKWFYLSPGFFLYTLFTLLALYTHYFSFFVLLGEILYLIYLTRNEIKKLFLFVPSFVLIALGYYPWFDTMIEQIYKGQSWRGGQTAWAVIYQFLTFIKDIGMGFYHRYINDYISYLIGAVLIVILSLAVLGLRKFYRDKENLTNDAVLVILIAAVPFICAVLVSFKQWIEYFRYLSIIIPFILICIVLGMNYFKKEIQYAVIVVLAIVNFYGLYLYYINPSKNNDYRVLIKTLEQDEEMNEIYVYPHYFSWILSYYYGENLPPISYYGWEFPMLADSIKVKQPEKFRLIMDYHSMDSLKYTEYLQPILSDYDTTKTFTFNIQPNTVKLFYLKHKE